MLPATDLEPRPASARSQIVTEAMRLVQQRYVAPERIDPPAMLGRAVGELGKAVPGTRVREEGGAQVMQLDGRQVAVRPETATDVGALAGMLDALIAWVAEVRPDVPLVTLQAAALRGAVRPLDRWCTAVSGADRAQLLGDFRGSIAGIGCHVGRRGDAVVVLEVYPGTPAAEGGIRTEDRIVAIDGQPVSKQPLSEVTQRLRGPAGSTVQVAIGREDRPEPFSVTLTRRPFVAPTISSSMIGRNIFYLQVGHLAQNSGVFASRALLGAEGIPGLRGIILDLRGNSGGSMMAAGQIAGEFVDHGVLIETRGADGGPVPGLLARIDAKTKTGGGVARDAPLVVLVDHGTGSSAEVLTAALAWHDRALLIGERTFGKNVMQQLLPLGQEITLKLTVARSYAAGRPLPAAGIDPDIEIPRTEDGATSPRCLAASPEDEGPIAVLPPPAQASDGARTVAVTLLERYRATSRAALRKAIKDDLCPSEPLGR
jgi:carboxyl-terminal processing protease